MGSQKVVHNLATEQRLEGVAKPDERLTAEPNEEGQGGS